jgi:ribonuclease BN (tRNA processing enzyme)
LFVPGSSIHIYGAFDPVYQKDLKTILSAQMEYCYFPVRSSELKADISYTNLGEGETVAIGSTKITSFIMNHPVLTYGYRIDSGDKRIFFSADHERLYNIYEPEDPDYAEYQQLIEAKEQGLVNFMRGSDILLADCMYTAEEYESKVGWGHSTYDHWIDLASQGEVKHLLCSHHDPTRTDDNLDQIDRELQETKSWPDSLKVEIAREGSEFDL